MGAPFHSLGLPSCLSDLHVLPFSKRETSLVFCLSPLSLVIPVSLVQVTYSPVCLKLFSSQPSRSKASFCSEESLLAAGRAYSLLQREGPMVSSCSCRGRLEIMPVLCSHPASQQALSLAVLVASCGTQAVV